VVLLSTRLDTYKGDGAKQHIIVSQHIFYVSSASHCICIQSFILKHRFDLPPEIEHNAADFATLIMEIQEALTQRRSTVKKIVSYFQLEYSLSYTDISTFRSGQA
jgi:hypothetical protein